MDSLFFQMRDSLAAGTFNIDPLDIIGRVFDMLTEEVRGSAAYMAVIVILGALSGVLNVLSDTDKGSGASQSAFFACFTVMSAAAAKCFLLALNYALDIIHEMSAFITMLAPMLTALLMSGGQPVSASAFHPILSASVYTITMLTDKCIMPLVQLGAVLAIVNNLSGRVQVSGFTSLIQSVTKWVLTAVLTIFTGITAIYGFTTPVLDGISAKAVKFAVGSLVPVVGGLLSDAVETVAGGTRLMKNAVGTAGVISICVMCVVPVVKIAAIALMLKFTYAMTEPVTDKRISGLIKDIGKTVTTLLGMVITVAVLFIISVSILLASTNTGF